MRQQLKHVCRNFSGFFMAWVSCSRFFICWPHTRSSMRKTQGLRAFPLFIFVVLLACDVGKSANLVSGEEISSDFEFDEDISASAGQQQPGRLQNNNKFYRRYNSKFHGYLVSIFDYFFKSTMYSNQVIQVILLIKY